MEFSKGMAYWNAKEMSGFKGALRMDYETETE